jgi:hypothetical protein
VTNCFFRIKISKLLLLNTAEPIVPKPTNELIPQRQSGETKTDREIEGGNRFWSQGSPVNIEPKMVMRKPGSVAVQPLPTVAFEVPGKTLPTGIYQIEFSRNGQPIASRR